MISLLSCVRVSHIAFLCTTHDSLIELLFFFMRKNKYAYMLIDVYLTFILGRHSIFRDLYVQLLLL